MKVNLYEVVYETPLKQDSEEYKLAVEESNGLAQVIAAGSLKEAVEKVENQKLVLLKLSELKLLKNKINIL
jgi:hypothetical protein